MTEAHQLARELATALQRYKPQPVAKKRKRYPCDEPAARRARYERWKANRKQTTYMKRWGKLKVRQRFTKLAAKLGISEDAARMRWYRGQV